MNQLSSACLKDHFATLTDPRVVGRSTYPLLNILTMAICAVIAGVDTFTGMSLFADAKKDWFATFLDLSTGIPTHDTFGNVLKAIKPEEFERCLLSWLQSLSQVTDGQILPVDGKTLRGSYDRADKKAAIHMVSIWAAKNHLSLGQKVVAEKSNEITAIPELLKMVEISGALVTIDAMGCQKEIAQTIREQGADYVLAVKSNQGRLFDDVSEAFIQAMEDDFAGHVHDQHETHEQSHGRLETRTYYTMPVGDGVRDRALWKDLAGLGLAISERRQGDQESAEARFYILSRAMTAQEFGEAVRTHWSIENNLHWQLDVTFAEDACQVRKGHGPANFSLLRRLALSLLKNETTLKVGIPLKRQRAGWDNGYLEKVLARTQQL